ncbi:MAG: hypothetical protein ACOYKA_05810 [Legionellaceae bacterium]
MYKLIFYGLMASPPTLGHQEIIETLQAYYSLQKYTIEHEVDEENSSCCTVRNEESGIVFQDSLVSLGLSGHERLLDRAIKRALAKRGDIDYFEILCVPSADGSAVLGKSPSATQIHRLAMLRLAVEPMNEVLKEPCVLVSDVEMALSQLIDLPSYTVNTLIVLHEGLLGLVARPEHLLSTDEKKKTSAERASLLNQRVMAIHHYLECPTHEWLTPHGLIENPSQKDQLQIILVMGEDSLGTLPRWFAAEHLVEWAHHLIIIPRVGCSVKDRPSLNLKLPPLSYLPLTHSQSVASCSSSGFREYIALGCHDDRASWVSPEVLNYVKCHGLYQNKR